MLLTVLATFLLYPGLIFALVLAVLFGWANQGSAWFNQLRAIRLRGNFPAVTALLSVVLTAGGLALMPWPYHPAPNWRWLGNPFLLWITFESAFLLPILPGLLGPAMGARAASREAQISAAGRCVVWLALGAALWGGANWSLGDLPGRILLGLGGLLALPVAIGIGPFEAERSLSAAGAEERLDEATTALVRFARVMRGAALLAAFVVALVPPTIGSQRAASAALQLQPWVAMLLIVALALVITLAFRQLAAVMPRLPLPAALRWCWWRAVPLAVVGVVYLVLV